MHKLLAMASLITITGCASIAGEKTQPVTLKAIYDNQEVAGVGCTLMNDYGKWAVTTPASVVVHKSTGDLAVDCSKDASTVGHETVVSKSNGAVWGNIIAGGGIGYLVDRNTGAGFNYPDSIVVVLRKIGETVGLAKPADSSEAQTTSQ